jgi:hypothetical protein
MADDADNPTSDKFLEVYLLIILCFIYAKWMCKGMPAATSFVDKLQLYVAEWASAADEQNVVTEHRLHDGTTWVAYLQWYLPRTDAGDVRACYPDTATCPGPRQDPAGRDVPGAPRPDRRHSGKLR